MGLTDSYLSPSPLVTVDMARTAKRMAPDLSLQILSK